MLLEVLERAKLLGGIKSKVMYVFVFIDKVMRNIIFPIFGADTHEPGWLDSVAKVNFFPVLREAPWSGAEWHGSMLHEPRETGPLLDPVVTALLKRCESQFFYLFHKPGITFFDHGFL